mmetsp:Transcript_29746/g.54120  ORF Transcript_29746/g.54120 Transcript_29746/m.54120 type:complete len:474 (+) Transcript_29746:53-1474(+)
MCHPGHPKAKILMASGSRCLLLCLLVLVSCSHTVASASLRAGGTDTLDNVFPHKAVDDPCEKEFDTEKLDAVFVQFMQKHARKYSHGTEEYHKRRVLFHRRAMEVERHNCETHHTWDAVVNKFADRTDEEMSRLRGYKSSARPQESSAHRDGPQAQAAQLLGTRATVGISDLPESFSWRNLTSIQEVQDQGGCGSCWAFAAATTMRAHREIWMKEPKKFSVQQIVSCTPNPRACGGTGGCNGATAELAMDYVYKRGCKSEEELPYSASDATCQDEEDDSFLEERAQARGGHLDSMPNTRRLRRVRPIADRVSFPSQAQANSHTGMTGWTKLPENKLAPLMAALYYNGPVSVSISAGYSWNQYGTGILGAKNCPKDAIIDHAVVLIGYGEAQVKKKKMPYWLLMNSWGYDWGENGYIRIERRKAKEDKYCGTDTDPEIGSGCKGGPPTVWVCGMCGILYDTVIPHFEDRRGSSL